ncbi:hypothetical protein P7C70_g4323, partial [Phenoliferia sp. Uapishka_3]
MRPATEGPLRLRIFHPRRLFHARLRVSHPAHFHSTNLLLNPKMKHSASLLLVLSAIATSFVNAGAFADAGHGNSEGLKRHLGHGHGPEPGLVESTPFADEHPAVPQLFPSPSKRHKEYVERGGRLIQQLKKRDSDAKAAASLPTASPISTEVPHNYARSGSFHPMTAAIAGIVVAVIAFIVALAFIIRSWRRGPNLPSKNGAIGFNSAPRPFLSSAASLHSVSSNEKFSASYKENKEMMTLPSYQSPLPPPSPVTADITSAYTALTPRAGVSTPIAPTFPQYFPAQQLPASKEKEVASLSPFPVTKPRSPTAEQRRFASPLIRHNSAHFRSSSTPAGNRDAVEELSDGSPTRPKRYSGDHLYETGIPFVEPTSGKAVSSFSDSEGLPRNVDSDARSDYGSETSEVNAL